MNNIKYIVHDQSTEDIDDVKVLNTVVQIKCNTCKTDSIFNVNKQSLLNYSTGKAEYKVQDMFPHLTANQREIFINNMCGKCFDNLFKP